MEFVEHDVTRTPFPAGTSAADVIFARFLLAHLPDLGGTLSVWLAQLHSGGGLVLDKRACDHGLGVKNDTTGHS